MFEHIDVASVQWALCPVKSHASAALVPVWQGNGVLSDVLKSTDELGRTIVHDAAASGSVEVWHSVVNAFRDNLPPDEVLNESGQAVARNLHAGILGEAWL